MVFRSRTEAGQLLARALGRFAHRPDVIVLGLPRGGVPVAFEVAIVLGVPLDVFLVRKLGTPGQEELAMGAIATGDIEVLNQEVIRYLQIEPREIAEVVERERRELLRRQRLYRDDRPDPALRGKTVILVDDGLATGSTMRAAVEAVRQQDPAFVVVAIPTAAADTCTSFRAIADEIVCLDTPEPFQSVGNWYYDFRQTSDEEVRELLQRAEARQSA